MPDIGVDRSYSFGSARESNRVGEINTDGSTERSSPAILHILIPATFYKSQPIVIAFTKLNDVRADYRPFGLWHTGGIQKIGFGYADRH